MSKLLVTIDGVEFDVEVDGGPGADGFVQVSVNGQPMRVAVPAQLLPEQIEWAVVDTRPYELLIDHDLHWVQSSRGRHSVQVRDLEANVTRPLSGDGRIKAPIPGLIARVLVEQGQTVEVGQALLVLEAMKMENEVVAPRAGTVTRLNARPGQKVILHELLGEIS